jgi:Fe-S cluster assembly iron-binding protein IscA
MNFFSKFVSIFKVRKPIAIDETPLHFSEEAVSQIKSHLEKRPANVQTAFKVSVVYQKEKIICQVGFDDFKMIRKTSFDYPIPIIISEKDELFLKGSYIDYHKEEEAYFYYPNVHLEVSDRSKGSIFVFYIDRYVISRDSPMQEYSIGKENFTNSLPYLIKQLFETKMVESLYFQKNIISIEKVKELDKTIFEEKMADILLSYFEKCGYPLYITDTNIDVKQYAA